MTPESLAIIEKMYDKEATDAVLYEALTQRARSEHNREILEKMAGEEVRHRVTWGTYVSRAPRVNRLKVRFYLLMARIFGVVFTINLLEANEGDATGVYRKLAVEVPEALRLMEDEEKHEAALADMIKEERLSYISSMVLGLSDALVELTGALAGFTLALNNNSIIGLAGFITGVAATLSMAASEYLSKKEDPNEKHPLKAACYTGCAYLFAVALLLTPYALTSSPLLALGFCLFNAALVILGFNLFVSVVRRKPFLRSFLEMLAICFGVAVISFLIGWAARLWLNLDV